MYCRFVESPDNYFEHEDFQKVFDFNTRQTVNALGTAVNAISTKDVSGNRKSDWRT